MISEDKPISIMQHWALLLGTEEPERGLMVTVPIFPGWVFQGARVGERGNAVCRMEGRLRRIRSKTLHSKASLGNKQGRTKTYPRRGTSFCSEIFTSIYWYPLQIYCPHHHITKVGDLCSDIRQKVTMHLFHVLCKIALFLTLKWWSLNKNEKKVF